MIIKKYIADNMNEALNRIRYELGRDAVIISQRKVRKHGIKGMFSKKMIEVTAAAQNAKKDDEIDIHKSIEAIRKIAENNKSESDKIEDEKENKSISVQYDKNLIKEVHEMKSILNELKSVSCKEQKNESSIQRILKECDIDECIAHEILEKTKIENDEKKDRQNAAKTIESMINVNNEELKGRVVLVGPTGVGKTTTIAKLAGKLALLEKRKVGLITIDTYRIGAVEQLKTYADIMNIPFKVVFNMKEMESAVQSMKDCDVVLIDTTGRSSKNVMQLSELRAFIEKIEADSIHLVISCTTKNKDINIITEGYKILNYNNVIITKLDETAAYGSILNILHAAQEPLSFITDGQNVPDDIRSISSFDAAGIILGKDNIC